MEVIRQVIEVNGLNEGILLDRKEWRKLIHVPDPTLILLEFASEFELQNSHFPLEVTSETELQKFRMQRTCFPFASVAVGVFYSGKMERYL